MMFRSKGKFALSMSRLTIVGSLIWLLLMGCNSTPATPEATSEFEAVAPDSSNVDVAGIAPNGTELGKVDPMLVRIAANHVARTAESEAAPNWLMAHTALGPVVRFLMRPDIDSPAYAEFEVLVDDRPAGYIIVSTGEHDYPIPEWTSEGIRLTDQLLAQTPDIATFYKIDALAYVGEGPKGEFAAWLGNMPPHIEGMSMDALDKPQMTEISFTADDQEVGDPREVSEEDVPHTLNIVGENADLYELGDWESWDELKANYTKSYEVLLEGLRRNAAAEWEIMHSMESDGEGIPLIRTGAESEGLPLIRPMIVPLLDPATKVDLGEAERYVAVETDLGSTFPHLKLSGKTVGSFMISLNYPNGEKLALTFFTYDPATIGSLDFGIASPGGNVRMRPELNPLPSTNPVVYKAADGINDLVDYTQFKVVVDDVFGGQCWTGCGATGWAMLFGWADRQADAGNPYWASRWGIYRKNGGTGTNAVAPKSIFVQEISPGVWQLHGGIVNITKELRSDIGTWCVLPFSDSGATWPARMADARFYLEKRTVTDLYVNRNDAGVSEAGLRDIVIAEIKNHSTPAVIGVGWLEHYPMAYAYKYSWYVNSQNQVVKYKHQFRVINGWGGIKDADGNIVSSNIKWISADTWFAGRIEP
jgi:hypothetical protein